MNLCDISTVKKLMSKYGTGTKKGFGQNFLINEEVPYNIACESYNYHRQVNKNSKNAVIEIGPGIGSLTSELCRAYDKVIAVEIDKSLIPILDETLAEFDNVEVINADFLKLDLNEFLEKNLGECTISVCANLPYYITTPIIMALLENARCENGASKFTSITVMVQKEVALRLCADSKSSDYGAITASINYYGEAKKLFDVTPDNFLPAPKVTSSVVRIELYDEPKYKVQNEKMLNRVIAGAFAQRRKTLLNSLSSSFSELSKEKIAEIITRLGFDINIRGERLSIGDFCMLADEFYKESNK
ncbi:MAG: ribosomal RNA small subunit methyltransferase A [Clostridia bacterium]|nr:ribosomal RNA small subunit methyltransferase A [Clostridia bacterium]